MDRVIGIIRKFNRLSMKLRLRRIRQACSRGNSLITEFSNLIKAFDNINGLLDKYVKAEKSSSNSTGASFVSGSLST